MIDLDAHFLLILSIHTCPILEPPTLKLPILEPIVNGLK